MKNCAWKIFCHKRIYDRLESLRQQVLYLKEKDPDHYFRNFKAKLFNNVVRGVNRVREDPTRPEYLQGKTMGKEYRAWRRIKHIFSGRYRLFFVFSV